MSTHYHYALDPDGVNPSAVPQMTLYTGAQMPAIGLGTFGSDHATPDEIAQAVLGAIRGGYRHIDCAMVYGNEPDVGQTLRQVIAEGLPREELWITSKLWNDKHGEEDVIPTCLQSIEDLGVDYLDLYLIHWPFPNYHAPGAHVTDRSPDAKPYIHESYMRTWRQLEKLVAMGVVKQIGCSNMTVPKLELLLRDAAIKPAANEMELHPHFQQQALFDLCRANDIAPIGFSPLGSPDRPERDRTPEDTVDIQDPVVVAIAQAHGVHPALVCLKWAVQRGQAAIPMSTKRSHYLSNLRCVTEDPLTGDEMAAMSTIDKGCRLIKGQVFLWKDGQDWQDLWDINGIITPA